MRSFGNNIHFYFYSIILIILISSSCVPKATENIAICAVNEAFDNLTRSCKSTLPPNKPPIADNISDLTLVEDIQSIITLSYSDVDIEVATACQLTDLTHVTVTQSCSCDSAGVCTVGVTGTKDYVGIASFKYSVKTNGMVSNSATGTLSIAGVPDAPTLVAIANQSTNEDTALVLNFTVSDPDSTLTCNGSVASSIDPNISIVFSGTVPNCIATITPILNYFTVVPISITFTAIDSDGLTDFKTFTLTVNSVNDAPVISFIVNPIAFNEDGSTFVDFTVSDVDSTLDCTGAYLSASSSVLIPTVTASYSGVYPSCRATFTPSSGHFGTTNVTIIANDLSGSTTATGTSNAFTLTINSVNDRPDATAISWNTSSTTPTTSSSGVIWPMTSRENSTASPSSSYADITINSDVSLTGFETSQSVGVSATSDNQTLLKDSNITVTALSATLVRISFTTEKNQSGSANISVVLLDDGGTSNGGINTHTVTIALTISVVDDPPVLTSTTPAITTVDTNEGGMVVAGPFYADEDLGSTVDEDSNGVSITSITSDNAVVLPSTPANTAIKIFYDLNDDGIEELGEERNVGAMLETLQADDAHAHAFYLKLYPIQGVYGNTNITMVISDGTVANDLTFNFSLLVHPIAALHGGWSNIKAVGIKADKLGSPVASSDIQCNYNTSSDLKACDTNQTCTGVSAPHGSIIPDDVNILYWDSANKKCYRSQVAADKFSWMDTTTSCPITRVFVSPTSLGEALTLGATSMTVGSTSGFPTAGVVTIESEKISYTGKTTTTFKGLTRGYSSTTAAIHSLGSAISYTANGTNFIINFGGTVPTSTAKNQYYLDVNSATTPPTKTCYKSQLVGTGTTWGWDNATLANAYIPSKVTLSWNTFNISGSGPDAFVSVYGWNIYRREKGEDYDFTSGFLKTIPTDTMSVANASTLTFTDTTAIAGKTYYYLVRPVDSSTRHLSVSTPEIFSEVRVFAPSPNYAFVHRWMVNQEICNSMHMTTTTTNKIDPINNYRCPYNGPGGSGGFYDIGKDMLVDMAEVGCPYSPAPTCTSNGCIGISNPNGLMSAVVGAGYYDRNTGACYVNTDGVGTNGWVPYTGGDPIANSVLNPPIVNVSRTEAGLACAARLTTLPNGGAIFAALPSKKEYTAYSAPPIGMSDTNITTMEQGFSLDIQSRCNSSSANGLSVAYTDSVIPSTSYIYSLPGTATSGIRSLYTGSVPWVSNMSTETCSSRYGVQDVYGNVAEWVTDQVTCFDSTGNYTCTSNILFEGATSYGFDFITGPFNDLSGDSLPGVDDTYLTSWIFKDEFFNAGKFSFPVGMPVNIDILSATFPLSYPYLLDIGLTSGITAAQLHEDGIIVNAVNFATAGGGIGDFAQGGSYLSGNSSGRYSSELIPTGTINRPDVGFRCYVPITSADFTIDTNHPYYNNY